MPRLRRVDCSITGIARRRRGRGFSYTGPDGARITDSTTLERIRALAIPPAWRDVWICPLPNGHIQAVGVDSKGRRQYRYHDAWRTTRDRQKYDHMLAFAQALPRLRKHCVEALRGYRPGEDPDRAVVLATAILLLDRGCFRIGSDSYVEENGTFGLASLEKGHVRVRGDDMTFDFNAKGDKRFVRVLVEPSVAKVIGRLHARRAGPRRLFVAREEGRWVLIDSNDVNAHIKSVTGGDYTAKEFRTWKASVLAAVCLAQRSEASSPAARKRAITAMFKEVAEYLDDTPAVTRSSYVDPRIVDMYRDNVTIRGSLGLASQSTQNVELADRPAVEEAVFDLLVDDIETVEAA